MTDRAWFDDALCREIDPDLFYVNKGESAQPAKRICARCDVTNTCLEYALANDLKGGVWGGHTDLERTRIRSARRKQAS